MHKHERTKIAKEARDEVAKDPGSLLREARAAHLTGTIQDLVPLPDDEIWSRVGIGDKLMQIDRLDDEQRGLADSLRADFSPAESFFRSADGEVAHATTSRNGAATSEPRSEKVKERLETYRGQVEQDIDELISKHPEILAIRDRRAAAVDELKKSLVAQFSFDIRTKINEKVKKNEATAVRYRAPLSEANIDGLHEATTLLPTPSLALLRNLMIRRTRASIGVAGPRGCGKSTLVRWLVDDPPVDAPLHIPLAAPASYLPREFMLYLYQSICQEVLTRRAVRRPALSDSSSMSMVRTRIITKLLLIVAPLVACALGVVLVVKYATAGTLSAGTRIEALAGAIITTAIVPLAFGAFAWSYLGKEMSLLSTHGPIGFSKFWLLRRRPTLVGVLCSALLAGVLLGLAGLDVAHWLTLRRAVGAALVGAVVVMSTVVTANSLTPKEMEPTESNAHRFARLWVGLTAFAAIEAVSLIAGIGLLASFSSTAAIDASLVLAAAFLAAGIVAFALGRSWMNQIEIYRYRSERFPDQATRDAYEARDRILYQRSVQTGWTSSAKSAGSWMPFELSAGMSESTTQSKTPLGIPDIVDGIKSLISLAGPAVICIDELDKIESPERAREFLNEIKGVLTDTPRAYFLLSMSEDAIASFERRGLPFRDVFDSTFDEVVRVPYLSFEQSRALLDGRVIKLAPPFIGLAHCLSGGLPRDLIRMVDRMFALTAKSTSPGSANGRVDEIARELVHEEVFAKVDAVTAAIKQISLEPQVTSALRALHRLDTCKPGSQPQQPCLLDGNWLEPIVKLDFASETPTEDDVLSLRTLLRLTVELVGFTYYCRTLIELFRVEGGTSLDRLVAATEASGAGSLDELARARQNFAVNPYLAWDQVSLFRGECWQLPKENLPQNLIPLQACTNTSQPGRR